MIKFIAEIGSNHNRDLDRTKQLVNGAYEAGFWGVKIQLFRAGTLYANIPQNQKVLEIAKSRELPIDFIPHMRKMIFDCKMMFGASVFDLNLLSETVDIYDFLKVGSYEILRQDIFKALCDSEVQNLMFSTGMATVDEIRNAYSWLLNKRYPKNIVLFHCVSKYPTLPKEASLDKIRAYKQLYKCQIGYSDHTTCPGVVHRAIMCGASYIEMHVDLDDMQGAESMHGHCWPMSIARRLIEDVMNGIWAETHSFVDKEYRDKRSNPSDGMRPMKKRDEQ